MDRDVCRCRRRCTRMIDSGGAETLEQICQRVNAVRTPPSAADHRREGFTFPDQRPRPSSPRGSTSSIVRAWAASVRSSHRSSRAHRHHHRRHRAGHIQRGGVPTAFDRGWAPASGRRSATPSPMATSARWSPCGERRSSECRSPMRRTARTCTRSSAPTAQGAVRVGGPPR